MKKEAFCPDRKTPPVSHAVKVLNWKDPEAVISDNGTDIYIFHDHSLDATQLNLTFWGGNFSEEKPLVASTTIQTLQEGAGKYSSLDIAKNFDAVGSYLTTASIPDSTNIKLFFLNRYVEENMIMLREMLQDPHFPEEEMDIFLKKNHEEWRIRKQQVSFLAKTQFLKTLFGAYHPYGKEIDTKDFNRVQKNDLQNYYQKNLHPANGFCVLSGNVTPKVLDTVKKTIESLEPRRKPDLRYKEPLKCKGVYAHTDKKEAMQTAIIIGKRLFNRNHPDYPGFQLLNTILGGYFGSRLMQNLREEKGYTYGIYSVVGLLRFDGVFTVTTEVGSSYTGVAIDEIFNEMTRLQQTLVSEEELALVKQYYTGNLLQAFDGIMNKAELVCSLKVSNTPFDYFNRLLKKIDNITPEDIRQLAQEYLDPEDMIVSTAGIKP